MNLAQYDDLLSAYLDRELSPDERATLDRLLEQSSEARERLHELEITSRFMRSLPKHQLTADFADIVIDQLRGESLLRPEPVAPQPTRRGNVWWVGVPMAAAATLLFALGIWNYQGGHRNSPNLPSPSVSELAWSSADSEGMDQREAPDVVEIRGPTGEKQFELFVLSTTTEPNTIRCILAEIRDSEPAKSDSIVSQKKPNATQGETSLALWADQQQVEQLHGLLAQSDDGMGAAFPLVDIVTDMELPERIRVARVGPESRLSGLGGKQELLASRGTSPRDAGTEPAEVSRNQSPPSFAAAKPQSDSAAVRRAREMAPPAGPASKDKEMADQMASLKLVVVPIGFGFPLVIPNAAALQDSGQRAPRITQINTQPQVAGPPTTATQSAPSRTTPDHVGDLAKNKSVDQPGMRRLRQDDKESQRRVEVLLRFRNDRPE